MQSPISRMVRKVRNNSLLAKLTGSWMDFYQHVSCLKYILKVTLSNKQFLLTATPNLRELGRNAELQSIISRYICENNAASTEGK